MPHTHTVIIHLFSTAQCELKTVTEHLIQTKKAIFRKQHGSRSKKQNLYSWNCPKAEKQWLASVMKEAWSVFCQTTTCVFPTLSRVWHRQTTSLLRHRDFQWLPVGIWWILTVAFINACELPIPLHPSVAEKMTPGWSGFRVEGQWLFSFWLPQK